MQPFLFARGLKVFKRFNVIRILIATMVFVAGIGISSFEAHCENIVVVIDPGHGGEALGGNMDDRIERDINLMTAQAMKERLEQYEGVDVYLTRDNNDDPDISRKERLDIAKDLNADFLFSIHYNMSENHTLFGSEVWIQSQGSAYTKGFAFASIEIEALSELGLFNRGIKNKLDKDGTGEYYGILKYAEEYNIPAVIIEHCHLDEERDSAFWNEDGYRLLGQTDADSVAKYFKLSSSSLGIDNSAYENVSVEQPSHRLDKDMVSPEYCNITEQNIGDQNAEILIEAKDEETYIQYYQLSLNGGKSFGRLEVWEDRGSETQLINIPLSDIEQNVVVVVYDQYENSAISNIVTLPAIEIVENEYSDENYEYQDIEEVIDNNNRNNKNNDDIKYKFSPLTVLVVTLVSLLLIFNIIFAVVVLGGREKKTKVKNKNKVKKDNLVIEKASVKKQQPVQKKKLDDDDILEGFDWD